MASVWCVCMRCVYDRDTGAACFIIARQCSIDLLQWDV